MIENEVFNEEMVETNDCEQVTLIDNETEETTENIQNGNHHSKVWRAVGYACATVGSIMAIAPLVRMYIHSRANKKVEDYQEIVELLPEDIIDEPCSNGYDKFKKKFSEHDTRPRMKWVEGS